MASLRNIINPMRQASTLTNRLTPSPTQQTIRTPLRHFSATTAAKLARLTAVGRMASKPEMVETKSGRSLVRYMIASDYGGAQNRQTSWFRVASFEEGPGRDYLLNIPKG